MEPKVGDTIAVWFSCGAASAVAAKKTIEKYGEICTIRLLNNPIAEEHPDNRRFLRDCEEWLGLPIESVVNPAYPDCSIETVWADRKYVKGPQGFPCTHHLKRIARQKWENLNPHQWIVMGFTVEERKRHDRFVLTERSNLLPILIDLELTKDDCFDIVQAAGIELPEIYKLGYPNANCIGCVKAGSPTYWNHVRKVHPDIFAKRVEVFREHGVRVVKVKGEFIPLHDLDPNAQGRPLKTLKMPDCGVFCEEWQSP